MADSSSQTTYTAEERMPRILTDDVLKMIIDRSSTYDSIIHQFRGDVLVPKEVSHDGKKRMMFVWEPGKDALMNKAGVDAFCSLLYNAMSPDKIVTNLSDEEVKDMAWEMVNVVIDLIEEKGEEFGIEPANRNIIVKLIDDFYFVNLTASRRGTIIDVLKQGYERKEVATQTKPQGGLGLSSIIGR